MKDKIVLALAVMLALGAASAIGLMGFNLAKEVADAATGDQARAKVVGEAPAGCFDGVEMLTKGENRFEVGVNIYGAVIFKNRSAAFGAAKEKCSRAIEEMRRQHPDLGSFQRNTVDNYHDMIWQINWDGADRELMLQRQLLSKFMEFYENGDPHKG